MTPDDPFAECGDEPPQPEAPLVEVCELPNGYMLYRQENRAGGHTYWSDEIDGGVIVYDTCLTDVSTVLAALTEEWRRRIAEQREQAAAAKEAGEG